MSLLPQWVAGTEIDVDADTWIAVHGLAEQVHTQDCRETARMLKMLLGNLDDERIRFRAAQAVHNGAAMDESAAEQRNIIALAAVCADHLKKVGYRGEN